MVSTTTIRTQLQSLRTALTGAQEDDLTAQRLGHARTRCERLEKAVIDLNRAYGTLDALQKHEIEVEHPAPKPILANALGAAVQEARQDPLAAGAGDEPSVIPLLRSHAQDVASAAKDALPTFRGRNSAPFIDEDMLVGIEGRGGPLRARVDGATARLTALRGVELPSATELQEWLEHVREIREVHNHVADAAPSAAVGDFLRAVQTAAGATLHQLLDDEVLEYLRSRDLLSKYRVKPWGQGR